MVRLERFFGNMHCESHGTTSVTSRFMLRRTAREQLTYFEKADGQTLRPFIMMTIMHRTGARRGTIDPAVLVTVLAILFGGCAFIATACAVRGGITQHFDEWLLLAARDPADREKILGPAALEEVARDLTALGGVAALSLVTAAVSGYLLISRKYDALALLLSATLGGLFLSTVLKESFHRPRPTVVPHKSQVITSSFPSGHSLNSAVVYLTLGSLLAGLCRQRRLTLYFFGTAVVLTFLIGVSRVYMGVHYPSDVLAGWFVGMAWALSCGLVARRLRQRGVVERVDA
jgi:undecaprenyl-diphosphatase